MGTDLMLPPSAKADKDSHQQDRRELQQERNRQDLADLFEALRPENLRRGQIDWLSIGWIGAMHVGCLAAPFFFTWPALASCLALWWLTGSIGVCLGYHRYLTHRSLKLVWPARFFVTLCGVLSGQGSPLTWSAMHRVHHCRSDKDGDPHSPLEGKWWWSHMLWLFVNRTKQQQDLLHRRYVPDLIGDPMMRFFERTYGVWMALPGVALFAFGFYAFGGLFGGLSFLLWGLCVRMTAGYHFTWLVNSGTHMWGYRSYPTNDESRNNWFVAIVAWGEGWHNNHHAYPHLAPAGHRWWEFDVTWWSIRLLRLLRLATDVKDRIPPAASKSAPAA